MEREYEGERLTVLYEPKRCLHAAECVKALPDVFDPDARPWVDPEAAEAEAVAEAVHRCPTGALRYRRHDGGPEEPVPEPSVRVVPDGPLHLRGAIRLLDHEGRERWSGTRVALCRCGASANKPFCDNTHLEVGFTPDTREETP